MDARQLEYFLAIVDNEGFGRAAQKLHIAQPSLSQAIAALERELGVPLFHRIGRGVVLSDAGAELVEPARQVLRDLRTARSTMDSLKGLRRGRVELVTMPSPGIEPLGTLTTQFLRHHPGVTVSAAAAFTPDEVVEQVRQGVGELGLVGAPGPLRPPGLDVLPLEDQPFVLVGRPGPSFPDGDPVPRAALSGTRLIASPAGSRMRQVVDDIVAAGTDVEIAAEVAHRTSILPLVMHGVGLAVLPAAWAPLARRAGARAVRLDPPAHLHIALLSRAAPLTPAARAFLATAREYTPVDLDG
ncbi:MAG TPA: LysR family transcriptional regulator [Pseudonocardia sp.]|uniref:LysR family transcriptional regulator n=1 Tax=Pseudonocardia sp. TaxID=60912 RepID=UPI002B4AB4EA|nr:LysR family transcriptional regulator [Pseudonocardia sp.]HLU58596.1 LysR family transcriptional regulator [Pseudonocardia sp.]